MATSTEFLIAPASQPQLRPFDVRRDLGPVADLIEVCFADTLDPDGERYIQRMRQAASNAGMLRWAAYSAEWGSSTMSGFVWEQEGRVVGNLSLIPYSVHGRKRYLIANVAVHPDFRRQGIARRLTAQAVTQARLRHVPEVWLHVREENEAATTLYRSLQFSERARRTTWHSQGEAPHLPETTALTCGPRRSRTWPMQRTWLTHNYPPEVTWHQPFKLNSLRPGLLGALSRLGSEVYLRQWEARDQQSPLAAAAWQASAGFANILWLGAPVEASDQAVQTILQYARRQLPSRRPVALDYPARQSEDAIRASGFKEYQTLIWMSIVF